MSFGTFSSKFWAIEASSGRDCPPISERENKSDVLIDCFMLRSVEHQVLIRSESDNSSLEGWMRSDGMKER
jgi:hypothetical protein